MSLSTPDTDYRDPVFPGENWFFYWKTSPTLWESKLQEYNGIGPIFVPIFWGFHSEYEDVFDFANTKPETDLAKLYQIAQAQGKELIFLMSVTPMPFLPNGGLPAYLARNIAMDDNGMIISVFDQDNRLNKMYSFFDPKVFMGFKKFTFALGQYFSSKGISSQIYSCECYRFEKERVVSFLEDSSKSYDSGLSRYIQQNKLQENIESIEDEELVKKEYSKLIDELYKSCLTETVSGHFSGNLKFCFLGAGVDKVFSRSSEYWEHSSDYFMPMFEMMIHNFIPSSALLPNALKEGVLNRSLKNIVTKGLLGKFLTEGLYEDALSMSFKPLYFFEFFKEAKGNSLFSRWFRDIGLSYFFNSKFCLSYNVNDKFSFEPEEDDCEQKVFFFRGNQIDQNSFNHFIKLFMSGGKIILDISELDEVTEKKIHIFVSENNLKQESVSYLTSITHITLGDGILILFDGRKLQDAPISKINSFWEKVIDYMGFKHLELQNEEGIFYHWKTRQASSLELDYGEIRRLSIYNPTSYKKKVRLFSNKNFALLKVVDSERSDINSTPVGLDLKLQPGGSLSLDFGYFE